jgi:hypothetical protein
MCPFNAKQKNQQVSYGYAAQYQKRRNNDDIINKPTLKPKENSHLGIGTLITLSRLTDEMNPNYVLHASPSQGEERRNKWAWPLIVTEKKVNQNEAIFNFLEHNSLILNEWAVSDDGLDYMKLEPNLSTKIDSTEKEGDGRNMEVGGNKPFVGQKGKMAKNATRASSWSPGAQLKNGLNTWYSVVEVTNPNALPPLNAPYKVNVYPPACIADVSILD